MTTASTLPNTTSDPDPDTGPITTSTTSTTSPDSTEDDDPDLSDFILVPDGFDGHDCDMWAQDCPRGLKCNPYANDGGLQWNATRCVKLDDDPAADGESCDAAAALDGYDDCALGSVCWDETCTPWCKGPEDNPSCATSCEQCLMWPEAMPALCLPACNPLVQDCPMGQACYDAGSTFVCAPDTGDVGPVGAPCEYQQSCDLGLSCGLGTFIPGCDAAGCCTPYCNVDAAVPCPDQPGWDCTPYYEEPPACGALSNLGVCLP